MRPFRLDSNMRTLGGVFYPTGWMVLMVPGGQQAGDAVRLLEQAGIPGDALMLLAPEDIRRELAGTEGDDSMLPSAGTEGDTVRKITDLAAQGHHGLMVHAPHQADSDRVMAALQGVPVTYGQRYRTLVIEDLVD
jgi:hypothetical protein